MTEQHCFNSQSTSVSHVLIECSSVRSVSARATTSCTGTERSAIYARRNICEFNTHHNQEHDWSVMLIVGTVFRKALGDGKRAIILQPDWAKVSAGSLKTRAGTFDTEAPKPVLLYWSRLCRGLYQISVITWPMMFEASYVTMNHLKRGDWFESLARLHSL